MDDIESDGDRSERWFSHIENNKRISASELFDRLAKDNSKLVNIASVHPREGVSIQEVKGMMDLAAPGQGNSPSGMGYVVNPWKCKQDSGTFKRR
jgi:hypothetical protein